MESATYIARRGELFTYFDKTAAETWKRLTSDAPVSRIRATVRAGREEMRRTLLNWLPQDLRGCRLLDAGCGTGALAFEAAHRGADVVAVDLSPTLVEHAATAVADDRRCGRLTFVCGDMLSEDLGRFDFAVAMDSLIHYRVGDAVASISRLGERVSQALLFTYAPRTPMLTTMHVVGRLFPKSDRAPAIEPVKPSVMSDQLRQALGARALGRTHRVDCGFYKSQAQELRLG